MTWSFRVCYSHKLSQVAFKSTYGGSAARPEEDYWPTETNAQAITHLLPLPEARYAYCWPARVKTKQPRWETADLGQFRQLWIQNGCRKPRRKLAQASLALQTVIDAGEEGD